MDAGNESPGTERIRGNSHNGSHDQGTLPLQHVVFHHHHHHEEHVVVRPEYQKQQLQFHDSHYHQLMERDHNHPDRHVVLHHHHHHHHHVVLHHELPQQHHQHGQDSSSGASHPEKSHTTTTAETAPTSEYDANDKLNCDRQRYRPSSTDSGYEEKGIEQNGIESIGHLSDRYSRKQRTTVDTLPYFRPKNVCAECHLNRLEDPQYPKSRYDLIDGQFIARQEEHPLDQTCIHYFFHGPDELCKSDHYQAINEENLKLVATQIANLC